MIIDGYEEAEKALLVAWIRQCDQNSWPYEAEIAEDVTTFVIDIVTAYIIEKYADDVDSLELAVQDAFTSWEERHGETSWFSEIVKAAEATWDNKPPAWLEREDK